MKPFSFCACARILHDNSRAREAKEPVLGHTPRSNRFWPISTRLKAPNVKKFMRPECSKYEMRLYGFHKLRRRTLESVIGYEGDSLHDGICNKFRCVSLFKYLCRSRQRNVFNQPVVWLTLGLTDLHCTALLKFSSFGLTSQGAQGRFSWSLHGNSSPLASPR